MAERNPRERSQLTVHEVGEVVVATLRGAFTEASVIDNAFAQLHELLDAEGPRKVLLNLGEVSFASSMMVAKLVSLYRSISQRGGSLASAMLPALSASSLL